MAAAVYILNALTTALCAWLLLGRYRHARSRLLLWSGLCFAGLAVTNVLVFVDLVILPDVDLFPGPLRIAIIAMGTASLWTDLG